MKRIVVLAGLVLVMFLAAIPAFAAHNYGQYPTYWPLVTCDSVYHRQIVSRTSASGWLIQETNWTVKRGWGDSTLYKDTLHATLYTPWYNMGEPSGSPTLSAFTACFDIAQVDTFGGYDAGDTYGVYMQTAIDSATYPALFNTITLRSALTDTTQGLIKTQWLGVYAQDSVYTKYVRLKVVVTIVADSATAGLEHPVYNDAAAKHIPLKITEYYRPFWTK